MTGTLKAAYIQNPSASDRNISVFANNNTAFANNITVANNATIGGNTAITGTLTVTGNITSNLTITGNTTHTGLTTFTGDIVPATSYMRNRIINGSMAIDQRFSGSANNATTSNSYVLDRWAFAAGGAVSGTLTAQRVSTSTTGSPYAIRLARTSGTYTNSLVINQVIETINCYDLAGQNVTLSFKTRKGSAYTAGLVASVITGTGSDQGVNGATSGSWTGYAVAGSTTISNATLSTSFQTFSVTCAIGSSVQEICVNLNTGAFSGTGGANDYIDITDVQLEVGSVATPFERRQYGQELSLCERYYEAGSNSAVAWAYSAGSSQGGISTMPFRAIKRTTPTMSGTIQTSGNYSSGGFRGNTTTSFSVSITTSSTVGQGQIYYSNWSADAEL